MLSRNKYMGAYMQVELRASINFIKKNYIDELLLVSRIIYMSYCF